MEETATKSPSSKVANMSPSALKQDVFVVNLETQPVPRDRTASPLALHVSGAAVEVEVEVPRRIIRQHMR